MLIPGFFGFADLGEVGYFGHVRRWLLREAAHRAVDLRVHVVRTAPTASLVRRAERLGRAVDALEGEGPVHLVGHSTGGLDARVLCTPGVRLPGVPLARVLERVRTVVTVATPHRGTPLARAFQGVRGRRLLRGLSLATLVTLRTGRRPVTALVRMAAVLRGVADKTVGSPDLVDEMFASLLDRFDETRRDEVQAFLAEVGRDTSLVGQLTPEAAHPLGALAPDRVGLRYLCVLTRSPPPKLRQSVKAGPRVGRQAALGLYAALYGIASRSPAVEVPSDVDETLRVAFGEAVPSGANDAIVPTWSQPWGRVVAAVRADHLDVLGHYADRESHPPHYDWLPSGAGFDRARFEDTWSRVLDGVLGEGGPRAADRSVPGL